MRVRRQQVILGFIADFYCHPARLVIEVDGSVHNNQRESDAERDAVFEGAGLLVRRISNTAVETDLMGVVTMLRAMCEERVGP